MDEHAIIEDIAERIIDEQVYPYLVERICGSMYLSPSDLADLGLEGWDAPRLARTIADALLDDVSDYAVQFRYDAVSLSYDPHEPLDADALDTALMKAYPPRRLTSSAITSVARLIGENPDGPALIEATGRAMSRVEPALRRS